MWRATRYFLQKRDSALQILGRLFRESDGKSLHLLHRRLWISGKDLWTVGGEAFCKAMGKTDHAGRPVSWIEKHVQDI
jgi:hypothetical protein